MLFIIVISGIFELTLDLTQFQKALVRLSLHIKFIFSVPRQAPVKKRPPSHHLMEETKNSIGTIFFSANTLKSNINHVETCCYSHFYLNLEVRNIALLVSAFKKFSHCFSPHHFENWIRTIKHWTLFISIIHIKSNLCENLKKKML